MPLIEGKSNAARSENIATEIREGGKSPAQAAAIAYETQRKAQDAASPMSSLPEVVTQQESFKRGQNLANQAGGNPPEMYGGYIDDAPAGRMK